MGNHDIKPALWFMPIMAYLFNARSVVVLTINYVGILLSNAGYYHCKMSSISNVSDPKVSRVGEIRKWPIWILARSQEVSMGSCWSC